MKCSVVILAAGEGTRMRSSLPKVLHKAAGLPLAEWVVRAAEQATGQKPILVYGSGGEQVPQAFGDRCAYALQAERKGTGHAVMTAEQAIRESECSHVVVLAGDMPLMRAESVRRLMDAAEAGGYAAMLLTGMLENPTGYGRILRDANGDVLGIVEEADATGAQRAIREVNISIYCFETRALLETLPKLTNDNQKGEYYLTDCIAHIRAAGGKVGGVALEDFSECLGVNDRVQLAEAGRALRARINEAVMRGGATLIDPTQTYIGADVTIEPDAVIYPGVTLEGHTRVCAGATLYQGSRIADSVIGPGATVENSVVLQSKVGAGSKVGPYAYLRPGSRVGEHCRVGDFVEVKNSTIGDRSKVSHLTYIGDGDVGSDVNIGCGVVFVNYNGTAKYRAKVGDGAFVGCNTNLISPVEVGAGAYIAAGATVTRDVPENALCIARAREVIKPGWAKGRYTAKK